MKVKFFRNAEAAEAPAAAPETEVVVEAQSQPATDLPSDFMAQMAKSARLVNEGEEAPEYKAEVVADPPEAEPVVATDSQSVKGQADTPAKTIDEPIVATQPIAAEPPTEVNWKEQLLKEPPTAILKELGYDERMVNFLEHWKSGGDITEYLKEVATDYTKMDAAELMRHQLRLDYPDATEEQLEVLYEDEVLHKYKMTDDYSEEEQRRGKLLLDAKVSKFRPEFVARQQSKLLPPAPEKAAVEPTVDPVIEQQRKLVDDSRKSVLDSPYYRKVLTDNKITFGEGGEAFNFPVDANELPDILYNGEKFVQSLFKVGQDANGDFTLTADPEHQMLVAATAKYGKQLFVELAKHYKALGSKKAIDPIENPSTIQTTQSNVPPEAQLSEIAQMAKYGKVT
jgi:hypothetical protein